MKLHRGSFFKSLVVCAGLTAIALSPCVAQRQAAAIKGVNRIMIDPGHGGKDAGTVYANYREKAINLSVALMLGEMIEKNLPGVEVLYTRKTDVFVPVYKRGEMANEAGADLFISIHVNSVDKGVKAPSGALTLLMGPDKTGDNLAIAMRENDVISYESDYSANYMGYEPGSAESYIIFTLMQYVNIEQSMTLANIIQKHYKQDTPMKDLGARQQNLLVLWRTTMPGVLTELGFLPNDQDRKTLVSKEGQRKMARALFNAVSEYKSRIEGNSNVVFLDAEGGSSDQNIAVSGSNIGGGSAAADKTSQSVTEQVYYSVQVCSSPRKIGLNGPLLKPYRELGVTEKKIKSSYKYWVGKVYTYDQARQLQTRVRKTTPDAFVVAVRAGEQISVQEARRITK